MLTPRTTLARRITAALDASPSRIPVLVGGCGSGRTTVLRQLRDRIGRTSVQPIDVERTATTPERFLHAVTAVSPFPVADLSAQVPAGAGARTSASEPATFLLDEFLELRTFESFPGLRRVLHDCIDGLASSPNRFVLTSRYVARTLRLLRDQSARFEVIHMPALTADRRAGRRRQRRARRRLPGAHGSGAGRRPPRVRQRARRRTRGAARTRRAWRRRCDQRAGRPARH